MDGKQDYSRRTFLKKFAALSAFTAGALPPAVRAELKKTILARKMMPVSPNDRLQIATIGMGIIGFIDTQTAISVPGVEVVAACDLYDGRLIHAKEIFGDQVYTTKDYRQILDRNDIDAVLICTPDHWHARISVEAMEAGKHVYCEKPMMQDIKDGPKVINTQKRTKQIFQVGSQLVSSIVFDKARRLYESGVIGNLNMIEAILNRNSAIGAWQYTIPPDASPETIDWDQFIGHAPKRSFDPVRFFRWRNYWDYGTGVPGDLFVHLFSGIHYILSSKGPERIVSTGGIRFWQDGRDVPDVMMTLCDYPETNSHPAFNLVLETNFAHGGGGGRGTEINLVGSEGVISLGFDGLSISHKPRRRHTKIEVIEGYNSVRTFSEEIQNQIAADFEVNFPRESESIEMEETSKFTPPDDYYDRFDHFLNFFNAIRENTSVMEDARFGYRAAAPAILSNTSYLEEKPIRWDPEKMRTHS